MTREKALQIKMGEIDENTVYLIEKDGFTFDGKIFSLSQAAQLSNTQLATGIALGVITEANSFPFPISAMDNSLYNLQWSDVNAFFGTMASTIKTIKLSGSTIKNTINGLATVQEILTYPDNRV